MSVMWYYCLLVVYVLGQGAVEASTCTDHPFLDECIQRKAANRTNGFITIAECKTAESTRGTIVLLGVYVGDDVLTLGAKIQLENTTQIAGTSNDCLTRQLRPEFTGSKGWSQRVAYGMCGVDASKGYILLEYTCVAVVSDQQKLEFPPCKGKYNGNRIRIQNKDFPNVGIEAVTHPDHCECTINTAAKILNITTYYMDITDKQSLSIIDGKGYGYVSKNLSKDDAMRSYALNVTEPLTLDWTNSENARNGSKFWLEVEANGTRLEVDCEPKTSTTTSSSSSSATPMMSTKRLTSISAPFAKTGVNQTTNVTSRTSTIPQKSENTVPNFLETSSPPTKYVSRLGVTPDGGHTKEAKSDLGDEDGSKFPILPIVIGLVLLLVIVIICVAIAVYIKKKKAKQKVQNTDDKDELADSNNDEDNAENNSYQDTVTNPSNTKFTAAASLIPATQFPPLSNQVPAVRSTPYDAIDQQNVREEEENEVTEERKKKKKKTKKKRKKKNAVFPEEELNDEPHNFQEETDNVTLGDNIDDN